MTVRDFDFQTACITGMIETCLDWKNSFLGAAYTTRLTECAEKLRIIADRIDKLVKEDRLPSV